MVELRLASDVELKLYMLRRDKKFLADYLKTVSKSMNLNFSRGKLIGEFEFPRQGMYHFDVFVHAKDPAGKSLIRTRTFNTYARIGKIDPDLSRIQVKELAGDRIEVRLSPRDSSQGLLGPGQARKLKLTMGEKKLAAKDNLDGSYSYILNRGQARNRSFLLKIGDVTLHEGPLL